MKQTFKGTDYIWAKRPRRLNLPIEYRLPCFGDDVDFEAEALGTTPTRLWRATESLIRNHHRAAVLTSKAFGRQPEIYELGLGSLVVMYSVELQAIVVCGYRINWPTDQTPEEFCSGFVVDYEWLRPFDSE